MRKGSSIDTCNVLIIHYCGKVKLEQYRWDMVELAGVTLLGLGDSI